MFGSALAGFGRVLTACTQPVATADDRQPNAAAGNTTTTAPTDGSEFVPAGKDAPPAVIADTGAPTVPNAPWESRFNQLKQEQLRVYGPCFSAAAPGVFAGKERSHVPTVTSAVANGVTKVTVLVEHVMGDNALPAADAGATATADAAAEAGSMMGGGNGGGKNGKDAGADGGAEKDAAPPAVVDAGPPKVHFITTIFCVASIGGKDTVVGLWEFASTDPAPPSVTFTMPAGVTSVTAYEQCTLHGLWKTDAIAV